VDGQSYAQFIAPAILGITMMQSAFFETTYGSFVRMWFQKTWEEVTATPLTLDDVLVGEITWSALKSAINATLMAFVVAAFGLLPWPLIPVVSVIAFVAGLLFGGIGLMFSAKVKGIDGFSFAMYLFITPMMLFSGTFFPLHNLPDLAQRIAYALPLTHVVLVTRPLVLGQLSAVPIWSVVYLVVGAIVFPAVAIQWMKRKLLA
jgi:lipooligosaccharide transport system permease protein